MYEFTDKVISAMNRRIVSLFEDSKRLIRQDELNVISGSKKLYTELSEHAYAGFLRISKKAYKDAHARSLTVIPASEKKERTVSKAWLMDKLTDYDPITGYIFTREVSRKRARFAESVISQRKSEDFKRAMHLWAMMVAQYAIETTDNAAMQAYEDDGVKYVRWNTEEDERVCEICKSRNNQIYEIDKVPSKPHYGCRCYMTPVSDKIGREAVKKRKNGREA